MNLGFDFDKIFINYPPLIPNILIDRLYKQKSHKTLKYRIPKNPEQLFRIATHHPLFRPIIHENVTWIKNLSKNKRYKCYLISSRFGFLKNRTEAVVKKHAFNEIFEELFFNFQNEQPHIFKNKIIKKLNIHRYVDDDLELLGFLVAKNPKTRFFWLNKKNNKSLGINLFAITKLSDILKK